MKPALIIGSTCVDVIINVDHLPKTQENLRPTSQSMALGGCAFNTAQMFRLLHAPHTFITPVGSGMFGDYVASNMKRAGSPISVSVPDQENGCCYCLVESSGERTFLSYHGVEYTFQKEWMEPYLADNYDLVYVCGLEIEESTGDNLIEYLEEHPSLTVCYAPGPRGKRISPERTNRMMALHPMLHINEQEAMDLSGCTDVKRLDAFSMRRHRTPSSSPSALTEHSASRKTELLISFPLSRQRRSSTRSAQAIPISERFLPA